MMGQIKALSAGHPVAEIFLVGFAFAYLVEGEGLRSDLGLQCRVQEVEKSV